jgi:hypothetical protein
MFREYSTVWKLTSANFCITCGSKMNDTWVVRHKSLSHVNKFIE